MNDQPYPVELYHRPRRVAFLYDLKRPEWTFLNAIIQFNLDSWGGRHNPIIPCQDGQVLDSFWPLLDLCDPDVVYSFVELSEQGIKELHFRLGPTLILNHASYRDDAPVTIDLREQASIDRYLLNLRTKFPGYAGQPDVLSFSYEKATQLSDFVRWNFGYSRLNEVAVRDYKIPAVFPPAPSDADTMAILVGSKALAWNIHICADAPLRRVAVPIPDKGRPYYLPIFYGSHPNNAIAYWNDAYVTGRSSVFRGAIRQMWLTPEVVSNQDSFDQLTKLLRTRVFPATNNSSMELKLFSCDTSLGVLSEVGEKLASGLRGTMYFRGGESFDPATFPTFKPMSRFQEPRSRGEVQYVTGNQLYLSIHAPVDVGRTDEVWMMDTKIGNPSQDLGYINAEPWWALPRGALGLGMFTRQAPNRVSYRGVPSFEVSSSKSVLHLSLPSTLGLFRHYFCSDLRYWINADARSKVKFPDCRFDVQLSDKGRYIVGVLGLSPTLGEALYLVEHPFWRRVLTQLAVGGESDFVRSKLAARIKRDLTQVVAQGEEAVEWLQEQIIFAGKNIKRHSTSLTFEEIKTIYDGYLAELTKDQRESEQRYFSLRDEISELTRREILFQGAVLKCPTCGATYFHGISELQPSIKCRGCLRNFSMPAETRWSYKLNELVGEALREHGAVPVLRTIGKLFKGPMFGFPRSSFFFTPSLAFIEYDEDGAARTNHEVDLAWIRDGEFGIGEVKTTAKYFTRSVCESMVSIAGAVRPQKVLFAATEGSDHDLEKHKKWLTKSLVDLGAELVLLLPSSFK